MEEKINIAEILRHKPYGIKLYSPIFGECTFCYVREDTNDICVKKHNGVIEYFNSEGLYFTLGEVMLFPSKNMRNWSKFAWKKGDLLINSCGFQCIFKEWASDDYTKFNGCYSNNRDGYEDVSNAETANFVKLDDNTSYEYIRKIERKLDGKLNLKTLEIEKTQPKFKDGDIVFVECEKGLVETTFIYKMHDVIDIHDEAQYYAAIFNKENKSTTCGSVLTYGRTLRFATDSEKQQLFEALAKEGKAWDAEKKQIVDIKKEHQFKPFEKVLVRDDYEDEWRASFFSHIREGLSRYVTTGLVWKFCIPYEGNEHLLGTTKDM